MPEWFELLEVFGFHAGVALVLTAPVILWGRKRVHWYFWELLAFVVPYLIWWGLFFMDLKMKSLANLAEPIFISLFLPVAAIVRVRIGGSTKERSVALRLQVTLCVIAIAVYFVVPCGRAI